MTREPAALTPAALNPTALNPGLEALLHRIADGSVWSGARLGEVLGISRAAVWKRVCALRELGLPVVAVRGQGYRLNPPVELLQRNDILNALSPGVRPVELSLLASTGSTNAVVAGLPPARRHACVVLAEHQRDGRGRRGRQWYSPFGANIYLSVGWTFDAAISALARLSLAAGVCVVRALQRTGIADVQLKWPNDIRHRGRKLGGCLVEIRGDSQGPCTAIVGIGLNYDMPADAPIDQAWTCVRTISPNVGRNDLAARLIEHLLLGLTDYAESGFAAFANDWTVADELNGQPVTVELNDARVRGVAAGISSGGGLLVRADNRIHEFLAGDVSVRAG